jgi:hypothetical protein
MISASATAQRRKTVQPWSMRAFSGWRGNKILVAGTAMSRATESGRAFVPTADVGQLQVIVLNFVPDSKNKEVCASKGRIDDHCVMQHPSSSKSRRQLQPRHGWQCIPVHATARPTARRNQTDYRRSVEADYEGLLEETD